MASMDLGDAGRAAECGRPLRTAAMVIYGTLLLLMLAVPQGLVNWLRDMEDNPAQQVILRGAEAVQIVSRRLHADTVYVQARAAFLALTGKSDD